MVKIDDRAGQSLLRKEDRAQLAARGMTEEQVLRQLHTYRKGTPFPRLLRPCAVGDGIVRLNSSDLPRLIQSFRAAQAEGRVMKFVPASGAATRMFRPLLEIQQGGDLLHSPQAQRFFQNLTRFPFYPELLARMGKEQLIPEKLTGPEGRAKVLAVLIEPQGLNYADIPKALLPFHRYGRKVRTPLEEHLSEAVTYTRDCHGVARIHFTVSPGQRERFEKFLQSVTDQIEQASDTRLKVEISEQDPRTDIIAVDPQNRPFREDDGRLHFRPGGHGALLQNLNQLNGDVVFIKNIDNVVPESRRAESNRFKAVLGGVLVETRQRIFDFLRRISGEQGDRSALQEAEEFARQTLAAVVPAEIAGASEEVRRSWLAGFLNRPLRVCGMVKNQGEPGGGPFWIDHPTAGHIIQIVEAAQINHEDPLQEQTWKSSTHFNPTDMVCSLRDYQGNPFDLTRFADPEMGFIAHKSWRGRQLKALELPGLWNGSMAFWNNIFVEIPIETFNPVKTVFDLLRPEHQPAE